MVHVPIHDQNFLGAVGALQIFGADRHGVEQTKPHGAVAQGMMARRPHQSKTVAAIFSSDRIEQTKNPPTANKLTANESRQVIVSPSKA